MSGEFARVVRMPRTDAPFNADAVVAAVRRGELDRFEDLIAAYQGQLWAIMSASGFEAETARDLVQQTFIEAYTCLARYQQSGGFDRWLKGIGRNLARRELRSCAVRYRHHEPYRQHVEQRLLSEAADDHDPRLEALRDCREGLGGTARQILHLFYDADLSLADIALRLGRSVEASRQLLWRTRGVLRKCIDARLGDAT